MLLILRSTARFWASIAASPVLFGPVTEMPPAAGLVDAVPEVDPDLVVAEPDEFAVPALLVPGGETVFEALPAPLGSLSELLRPPALAGPDGTPLTPAVPAPAEPAFGDPTALPLPAEGPLAAPAPLAPPAPPAPCANETAGQIKNAIAATAAAIDGLVIAKLPLVSQR
jgi:ribonuclease E